MSILVTGGAGYIGGHMALGLIDAGETVVVLDNLSTGFAWAVPAGAKLVVGDTGDAGLVARLIEEHAVDAIAHFAAKIVVPELVSDPLGYYLNNVSNARTLIEAAIKGGVKTFIFSSTAAVYGETAVRAGVGGRRRSRRSPPTAAPSSWSNGCWRTLRARTTSAMWRCAISMSPAPIRKGRLGQSTPNATHLIKRAVQTALGMHPKIEIFGEDYPTRDGTCVRDYIQVTDLIDAHLSALAYLRAGGASLVCNCGYGHGQTVKEVVAVVKRVSGVDFPVVVSRTSRRRSGRHRRQGRPGEERARLETGARQSRRDRAPGARLGAPAAQSPHGRVSEATAVCAGRAVAFLDFTTGAPAA